MEGRRWGYIKQTNAHATPLTNPRVEDFIWLKLTQYGLFSTDEDNAGVAGNITRLLLSLCHQTRYNEVFHILFNGQAQTDFAREISTRFLSLDPAPNDPDLRSFVGSIFSFYQDIFWTQRIQPKSPQNEPCLLISDASSTKSDVQGNKLIAKTKNNLNRFFEFPGEIRDMIYKEALIAPEGALLQSFTPPPLLCACRRLRGEALPLFYKYNNFPITVKRSPQDKALAHCVAVT